MPAAAPEWEAPLRFWWWVCQPSEPWGGREAAKEEWFCCQPDQEAGRDGRWEAAERRARWAGAGGQAAPWAQPGGEPEWIAIYHSALAALVENDPAKARELFLATEASKGGRDGPCLFFLKRLDAGEPIRDGVVEMTEK